ncbi:hypothetical protein FA95DRAFT_413563 [Auriscalpium vulgare]|uniref:Uncharacterized protein n=1 Tax=Auriscalpium vulgare TaxID=40419 RepID=A0ACB8S4Y3_9AGAM|nr:hypothetical protein FA95DRAFT_413563 [Auriscalpium vulgare]
MRLHSRIATHSLLPKWLRRAVMPAPPKSVPRPLSTPFLRAPLTVLSAASAMAPPMLARASISSSMRSLMKSRISRLVGASLYNPLVEESRDASATEERSETAEHAVLEGSADGAFGGLCNGASDARACLE